MKRPAFLKILREQSIHNPLMEKAEAVYKWASYLTAESRYSKDIGKDYYITEDAKLLLFKLTHQEEGFIGVKGFQGVGKTSLLQQIARELERRGKRVLFFRWTIDWRDRLAREGSGISSHGLPYNSVEDYLVDFHYVFIDLPDYSRRNRNAMNRDLANIEDLWKAVQNYQGTAKINHFFVIGVQKEMFESAKHFLFGKMDFIDLAPLKPSELVAAYKTKWQTVEPFTNESLLLVGELSRGIFRRFLKYIQRCIEAATLGKKEFPISISQVQEVITFDQLVKDMDLELSELFTNKEQKMLAVKLLNCIREQKQINQSKIAESLDTNDMTVSRMIQKLEAYGYVKRQRGEHAEWLINLC